MVLLVIWLILVFAKEKQNIQQTIINDRYSTEVIQQRKLKMSRFTIALFDDGLQLVPSSWLFDNGKMCHWPPYTNEKKIRKAIIEECNPDRVWPTHKILRIFGTSSTYESGIEKVKLAQDYSDLDISDVDNIHVRNVYHVKKKCSIIILLLLMIVIKTITLFLKINK